MIAACVISAFGLTRIGFEGNPRKLFRTEDDEFRFLDEVFRQFGNDDDSCYIVASADDLFSPGSIDDLRRLAVELRRVEGIESVESFTKRSLVAFDAALRPLGLTKTLTQRQLDRARQRALGHPVISGHLLTADGNRTLIKARLVQGRKSIEQMEPITDRLWAVADDFTRHSSLTVQMTGIPAIRVEAFNSVRWKSIQYTVLGALAGLAMAVLLMRRLATVFVVCVAAGCGAFWTVGAMGLIGENITVLTTVLPMLVLVIGLTDSVHLAFDIRHARGQGVSPVQATRRALQHLTFACFLTSLTTIVGFGSLGVSGIDLIRRFGLTCAFGCGITFLAVVTALPLLSSSWIGNGILPPRRPGLSEKWISVALSAVVNFALRHRWLVTVTGLILTALLGIVAAQLQPENEMSESLPQDARSNVALRTIDREFGGILPSFITVDWPEGIDLESDELKTVLSRVHVLCESNHMTNHPFSIMNLMQLRPNGSLARVPDAVVNALVRQDQHRAVVVTRTQDRGSAALTEAFADLRQNLDQLQQEFPGYRFHLTGSAVIASRTVQTMISDLASSLGLATAIILITMSIACRSLRMGLICLLPNALPLLITAAVLVAFDGKLRFASVIVFSVCLGIAVDDTIHVVTRFRRELAAGGDVDEAIRNTVNSVGSALVVTTSILVVGLSIPMTSDILANRMFGLLSCIAIFSALLADLILLPAMLACFVKAPATSEEDAVSRN